MAEWYDAESITDVWLDAPDEPQLSLIVEAALIQVQEYAPALPDGGGIPANYRQAQVMQTRNLWNATRVDAGGGSGDGDFIIRPFPLDWQVKALLRPKRGVPVIG